MTRLLEQDGHKSDGGVDRSSSHDTNLVDFHTEFLRGVGLGVKPAREGKQRERGLIIPIPASHKPNQQKSSASLPRAHRFSLSSLSLSSFSLFLQTGAIQDNIKHTEEHREA